MKKSFLFYSILLTSTMLMSQTVTINTTGNRNKQILVDQRSYTIDNSTSTANKTIVIPDLAPGLHNLELVRNTTGNRTSSSKSTFTIRAGYDLKITVSSNGSISSAESKIASNSNVSRGQLNNNAFNKMVTQTKAKNSSTSRAVYLKGQFTSLNKKMTSKQAGQLIQLVNSESLRLGLAKQVYILVSDVQNFSVVSNLLNSSTNRAALNAYITSIPGDSDVDDPENGIPNENFKIIYNEVVAESGNSNKTYYLNNFFGKDYNFFTSQQASQLIALISDEAGRLSLAKVAFRGSTDKNNYDQVSRLLNSSYSRSELTTYINSYNSTAPATAMIASDFDNIYQTAYRQNSVSSRYNTIQNAFTASGNYFTATQAARLIPLVNDDASRLSLSKSVYRVLVDKNNYSQFNAFLSTASRNSLAEYVNNSENSNTPVKGMTAEDFNKLYQDANSSWSNSTKFNLISDAFKSTTNYFTVSQASQLLSLVPTENDKLILAKLSVDNITDRENYSQLYELFTLANRSDLTLFITSYINGMGTAKVPMSDSEFITLYRNLQFTFGIGAKFRSVTDLFAVQTNYFTVAQAKQLIQLLSSESNRLELSKAVYDNITDITNFSQIYELLPSESAKNALKIHVESNPLNN